MKIDICCICGKPIKSKKGIGPTCSKEVGHGPNTHRAKFAKKQFMNTVMESRKMELLVGYDFDVPKLFCAPLDFPKLPDFEQELKIKKLQKYFYQAVYHSLSGPEQRELVRQLYEDKSSEDEA